MKLELLKLWPASRALKVLLLFFALGAPSLCVEEGFCDEEHEFVGRADLI